MSTRILPPLSSLPHYFNDFPLEKNLHEHIKREFTPLDKNVNYESEIREGKRERRDVPDEWSPVERDSVKYFTLYEPTEYLALYFTDKKEPWIEYYMQRIIDTADEAILTFLRNSRHHSFLKKLKLYQDDIKTLTELTRLNVFSAVRQHELFHYLTDRGTRCIKGKRTKFYEKYSSNVYKPNQSSGNLEEALAEAFGYITFRETYNEMKVNDIRRYRAFNRISIRGLFPSTRRYYFRDSVKKIILKIIEEMFISKSRPPGYNQAYQYIDEMIRSQIIQVRQLVEQTNLPNSFVGFNGLFDEIVSIKYHDPRFPSNWKLNKSTLPHEFLIFLENYRNIYSFFMGYLPLPREVIKVRI